MQDEKYVVFKREDLERFFSEQIGTANRQFLLRQSLDDAVVIRTQDLFAGPALHVYANSIALAAHLASTPGIVDRLETVVDYFSERADEADELRRRGVAHIPD